MGLPRKPSRDANDDPGRLRREIEEVFRHFSVVSADTGVGDWMPCVDVYEARGRFTIVMEVPGLGPESLRVVQREQRLTVTGERRHQRPPAACGFLCLDRPHGRFTRTVPLDEALDLGRAEARLVRGLLIIEIPRLKDRRGRETVIPVRREPAE